MIYAGLIFSIVFPWLCGGLVLRCLLGGRCRFPLAVSGALSLFLGWGILTHGMLLLQIAGLPLNLLTAMLPALAAGGLAWRIGRGQPRSGAAPAELLPMPEEPLISAAGNRTRLLWLAFVAVTGYLAWWILWRTVNIPIYGWDSLATGMFTAKVYFFDGNLDKQPALPYPIYPLHVPLLTVWTALCTGGWHDANLKLLFPLPLFGFTVVLYHFLRSWTRRVWAVIGILCLWSSTLFILHGSITYRDLFLGCYNCTALLLLAVWMKNRDTGVLITAALLTGMASFIKLEGIMYLFIHILLVGFLCWQGPQRPRLRQWLSAGIFAAVSGGILLFYSAYKWSAGISTVRYAAPDAGGILSRMPAAFDAFTDALLWTPNWNITWIWLFFSLTFHLPLIRSDARVRFFSLALILFLGAHFAVSVVLGISQNIISPFTISRLLLHFFALVPVLIVLINAQTWAAAPSPREAGND